MAEPPEEQKFLQLILPETNQNKKWWNPFKMMVFRHKNQSIFQF